MKKLILIILLLSAALMASAASLVDRVKALETRMDRLESSQGIDSKTGLKVKDYGRQKVNSSSQKRSEKERLQYKKSLDKTKKYLEERQKYLDQLDAEDK